MKSYFTAACIVASSVVYAQYTYGDACALLSDGMCTDVNNCIRCSWSWPTNTSVIPPYEDPNADCRCERSSDDPEPAPTGYPPLVVNVDGIATTLYVQHPDWSTVSTFEQTLKFAYNNRMYLSTVD